MNQHGLLSILIWCFKIFHSGPSTWGGYLSNFNFFNVNPQIWKAQWWNCLNTNFRITFDINLKVIRRRNFNSTSSMVFARMYLRQFPATSFSYKLDLRTGTVLCRSWFPKSKGFFLSGTDSVLTRLKRTVAALASRGIGDKITITIKIQKNGLNIEILWTYWIRSIKYRNYNNCGGILDENFSLEY